MSCICVAVTQQQKESILTPFLFQEFKVKNNASLLALLGLG